MEELRLDTVTGLLQFLAIQVQTGDRSQQDYAYDMLRGIIENLPDTVISPEDAVTIQALGITITQYVLSDLWSSNELHPEQLARIRAAVAHLLIILQKAGTALEFFSGVQMGERRFFDDISSMTVQ